MKQTFKILILLSLITYSAHADNSLNGRGVKILKNTKLFSEEYAKARIESLEILLEEDMYGYFDVNSFFENPPNLKEIEKLYGKADLVVPAKSKYFEDETKYTIKHYFGHVGFWIKNEDRSKMIQFVEVTHHNYSQSCRKLNKKTFDFIGGSNDKVFYDNGIEVGRHIYNKENDLWKTVGNIPLGVYSTYRNKKKTVEVHLDKESGKFVSFYPNGKTKYMSEFKDGKLEGKNYFYLEDGSINTTSLYIKGRKEGEQKEYYKTGELLAVKNYVNGKLEGLAKEFFKSGTTKKTLTFKAGEPVSNLVTYDETGKIIKEENIKN